MRVSASDVVSGLIKRGVPRTAAIGLAGNFAVESGFDTGINEISPLVKGSRGGFGLAQWTGPRRLQFEAYAKSKGVEPSDLDAQLDFSVWELENTEKKARDRIYAAQTPEDAAKAVSDSFLRPGIPHLERRLAEAAKIAGGGYQVADAGGGVQYEPEMQTDGTQEDYLTAIDDLLSDDPLPQGQPLVQNDGTALTETYNSASQAVGSSGVPDYLSDIDDLLSDETQSAEGQEVSLVGQVSRQIGLAGRSVAEGGAGLVGLAADPIASLQNMIFGTDVKPFKDQVSQALTSLGVPEPETTTEKIVSAINEGVAGALTGVGVASALGRNASTQTGRAAGAFFSAQPAAQVTSAGGASAAQQIAEQSGAGAAGQALAGIAGGITGSAATSVKNVGAKVTGLRNQQAPSAQPNQADAIVLAGKNAGIDVLTSDTQKQGYLGKWLSQAGEKIPLFGTSGARQRQVEQRKQAVKDVFYQFSENPSAISDDVLASVSDDLAKTQKQFVDKYVSLKNDVFNNVVAAGPVPVTKTTARVSEILKQIDGKEQFKGLASEVKKWAIDLEANKDIKDLDFMRQGLGEAFKDPSLANVRAQGDKLISSLYKPLREDIDAFVAQNGDKRDITKLRIANKRLSDNIGEISKTRMKAVLNKTESTPEDVKRVLFSNNASDVRRLYKNLSPNGKAKARAAILHDVIEKSGGIEDVSAAKFVTQINKRAKQVGVFFSDEDARAIDGLSKVLKATQRADAASVSTPTGQQILPIAATTALGSYFGAAGGLTAIGAAGVAARLYESPSVRDTLIKLSKVKTDSRIGRRYQQEILSVAREILQEQQSTYQDEGSVQ